MSLLTFLKNLFKPKETFVPVAPAATSQVKKPIVARERQRFNRRTAWVSAQLSGYEGDCVAILRVPGELDMYKAQNMVSAYMHYHYGKGLFRTKRFDTARTIHVRPTK